MKELNLNKQKKYLVAVSGGPDSMALMDVLRKQKYCFEIAHVNYHHRDEALSEQKMIEEYSLKYSLKLHIKLAYFEQGNFEDWAREERYTFFKEICEKERLDGCIVGHHQDDLLETYLLQLKRGFVEYYGLKDVAIIKNINIYRPLLKYRKKDLEEYCINEKIPYSFDVTNNDCSLSRNKIRHDIVNKLNENERNNLLNDIQKRNKEIDLQNEILENFSLESLSINDIKKMDDTLKIRLLYNFIKYHTSGLRLGTSRIKDIITKIENCNGNKKIKLNNNFELIKEYDCLNVVEICLYNYSIVIDKPCVIDNEFIYFDLLKDPSRFYIKSEDYPLIIENVTGLETVKIGNINKKVNRILIDEKIPLLQRLYWPKIVNNKGRIIYLPRRSFDETGLYLVKRK